MPGQVDSVSPMTTHPPGRYESSALAAGTPESAARLRAMAAAFDPHTEAVLDRLPLAPDWDCLELGAGPGATARALARRVASGTVTATDLNTDALDTDGLRNIRVLRHDATRDTFPDGSFDLVHCRNLLVHLPAGERDRLLARTTGWLRPGGWLALDELTTVPFGPTGYDAFDRLAAGVKQALRIAAGTDLDWPRTAHSGLAAHGYTNVHMAVTEYLCGAGEPANEFVRITVEQVRAAAVAHGILTHEDIDAGLAELTSPRFAAAGVALISAWAQRES